MVASQVKLAIATSIWSLLRAQVVSPNMDSGTRCCLYTLRGCQICWAAVQRFVERSHLPLCLVIMNPPSFLHYMLLLQAVFAAYNSDTPTAGLESRLSLEATSFETLQQGLGAAALQVKQPSISFLSCDPWLGVLIWLILVLLMSRTHCDYIPTLLMTWTPRACSSCTIFGGKENWCMFFMRMMLNWNNCNASWKRTIMAWLTGCNQLMCTRGSPRHEATFWGTSLRNICILMWLTMSRIFLAGNHTWLPVCNLQASDNHWECLCMHGIRSLLTK